MQEERVCQFYKLSIRKNGEIYPCCLARKKSLLGNLFDKNIKEIIETKNVDCSCTLFKDRPIQRLVTISKEISGCFSLTISSQESEYG